MPLKSAIDIHVLSWLKARYSTPLADGGLYKGILIDLVKYIICCHLHTGALRILSKA